jgi:hypothetical protein
MMPSPWSDLFVSRGRTVELPTIKSVLLDGAGFAGPDTPEKPPKTSGSVQMLKFCFDISVESRQNFIRSSNFAKSAHRSEPWLDSPFSPLTPLTFWALTSARGSAITVIDETVGGSDHPLREIRWAYRRDLRRRKSIFVAGDDFRRTDAKGAQ